MGAPQTEFSLTLPTTDNATPPNALVAGQITSVVFTVMAGSAQADYSFPVPATAAPGSVITAPFAKLTPAFVPVNDVDYIADVFAVDADGNGLPSASIAWTQTAPVPAAPTGFSVG